MGRSRTERRKGEEEEGRDDVKKVCDLDLGVPGPDPRVEV